ncbi:unnamed protein product [[Candida] boidinii]|nr:unnamed protein product [[Candida] boidinii]
MISTRRLISFGIKSRATTRLVVVPSNNFLNLTSLRYQSTTRQQPQQTSDSKILKPKTPTDFELQRQAEAEAAEDSPEINLPEEIKRQKNVVIKRSLKTTLWQMFFIMLLGSSVLNIMREKNYIEEIDDNYNLRIKEMDKIIYLLKYGTTLPLVEKTAKALAESTEKEKLKEAKLKGTESFPQDLDSVSSSQVKLTDADIDEIEDGVITIDDIRARLNLTNERFEMFELPISKFEGVEVINKEKLRKEFIKRGLWDNSEILKSETYTNAKRQERKELIDRYESSSSSSQSPYSYLSLDKSSPSKPDDKLAGKFL